MEHGEQHTAEKLSQLEITPEQAELVAIRDLRESIMRDVEAVMWGGYSPPAPTTLKLAGPRCPHCTPIMLCLHHIPG